MNRLQDRTAIIWGGAGSIGTATARRFVEEGATVYLAGRTEDTLRDAAAAVGAAGYGALDVLDEEAVTAFVARVVAETGRLDVSFNVAGRGDVQGTPLLQMPTADFVKPVVQGITGSFHTARAAARQMAEQGSGVVVELDSASGRGSGPMMGGTGAADGAKDALVRDLAQEVGPSGVRVVGIWTAGAHRQPERRQARCDPGHPGVAGDVQRHHRQPGLGADDEEVPDDDADRRDRRVPGLRRRGPDHGHLDQRDGRDVPELTRHSSVTDL